MPLKLGIFMHSVYFSYHFCLIIPITHDNISHHATSTSADATSTGAKSTGATSTGAT